MNVKIDHTGLRFKITSEELMRLKNGEALEENLDIGKTPLKISIRPEAKNTDFTVHYETNCIRLSVDSQSIQALENMGRSREGLVEECDGITLSLQVDFRTQKRQSERA